MMGEQLVHRWDPRGPNLCCSIFNANVAVHYCTPVLRFEAHLVLLHALWGGGCGG